jgi:hypothetical protein
MEDTLDRDEAGLPDLGSPAMIVSPPGAVITQRSQPAAMCSDGHECGPPWSNRIARCAQFGRSGRRRTSAVVSPHPVACRCVVGGIDCR